MFRAEMSGVSLVTPIRYVSSFLNAPAWVFIDRRATFSLLCIVCVEIGLYFIVVRAWTCFGEMCDYKRLFVLMELDRLYWWFGQWSGVSIISW